MTTPRQPAAPDLPVERCKFCGGTVITIPTPGVDLVVACIPTTWRSPQLAATHQVHRIDQWSAGDYMGAQPMADG